jgi:hypothetical protein
MFFLSIFWSVQGMELKALLMLGMPSTAELHPQPKGKSFTEDSSNKLKKFTTNHL